METKKTPRADLESKKGLFTEIGLVVALVICFGVFEWSTTAAEINLSGLPEPITIDEPILEPIIRDVTPTPPPPPAPKMAEVLVVVDDKTELETDYDWATSEANEDDAITYTTIQVKDEVEEEVEEGIIDWAEQMPAFKGDLRKYLAESVKYPAVAADNGIEGRVFVSFVVSKSGEVTDVKIARGINPSLDREAMRVVQSMPAWTPGMQRGRAVNVRYTVPINFVLR